MSKALNVGIIYTEVLSEITNNTTNKNNSNFIDLSEAEYEYGLEVIKENLKAEGYSVCHFGLKKDIKQLIDFIQNSKLDIIFNLCESYNHESINEMYIAGIYELLQIPYTGNRSWTLGTLIKKWKVKDILEKYGYLTPKYHLLHNLSNFSKIENLKYPLIVKPSREDASVGINNSSIVNDIDELKKQVEYVYNLVKQPILIEEYIDGRELNVAIFGNDSPEVLPISEIDFAALPDNYPKIVTYSAKWHENSPEYIGTQGVCPAKLDKEIEENLKRISLEIYKIFDCSGYARIDFRLDKNSNPYILEVNPNPDISIDAGFYRSAKNAGYTYSGMLKRIIELGLEKFHSKLL